MPDSAVVQRGSLCVPHRPLPPRLKRDGLNVLSDVKVSYLQAILGDTIEVETVDGAQEPNSGGLSARLGRDAQQQGHSQAR